MTTLLTRIRNDSLVARKARESDKATFLITLMAEASRTGKDDGNRESTDSEVTAVVKKFIKNADETLRALGDKAPESRARIELELSLLRAYLPKQATAEELTAAVTEIVGALAEKSPKQVGAVMAQLQTRFEGNFDKASASALVRAALAS